ncbi:hypothetical protein VB796_03965 [Arcicella sp. LKC2W]|uniref:hypothetical protein n=1 Tax=Arcicella sp. LKC2W TaxID=2984198 RepID=UPI002B20F002|nr:hypothetical protein [Arcicella sp. LKC2W]MEA5458175.1 hypothetical protein [Arcicella sp. LKC2W]
MLNKAKIEEIINLLKAESNEDNAYIGFFLENEPHSESGIETIISTNKDGLLLFAQRLISYSQELDSMEENESIYLGDNHPKWLDLSSDIRFDFLEKQKRDSVENNDVAKTVSPFKNNLIGFSLIALFFFLLTMTVYGFATFISLFFKK